ncbi:MAG: tRNA (adenosine(37)-N6)-threonylcarbamoyltransferase complex dimerization subunit type 1 TsaB [Cytophagia bacterium]|nr:tRNA (adenosine(37)-N6)-threonylcarbamoyltransferase complex dimerization subunit type 1 TsaB [Cytophagia bacterium]
MALILSIETSTTVCSVALTDGEHILAKKKLIEDKSHASHLTILIQEILNTSGKQMSDVRAVAISEGPGSYTGLRIGVSTAKGLCYALDVPLIGVSTLKAMALEAKQSNEAATMFCPMIDARRMEVYTALYDAALEEQLSPCPMILDESSFHETLSDSNVLFFGNGSDKFKSIMNSSKASFIDDLTPSAWAVGLIASEKFESGQFEDLAYFEPSYLKEFQATTPKSLL